MNSLSHTAIQGRLRKYMALQGWRRVNLKEHTRWKVVPNLLATRPDELFINGSFEIIVAEIKPYGIQRGEILKGVGQITQYINFKLRSILVCPDTFQDLIHPIIKSLNSKFGLILFDKEGNFSWGVDVRDNDIWWLEGDEPLYWEEVIPPKVLVECSGCGKQWNVHQTQKEEIYLSDLKCTSCGNPNIKFVSA